MLIVISPAKSLDMDTPAVTDQYSQPELIDHSVKLVERLKKKSPGDLSKLMGISPQLGELNFQRYQLWEPLFTTKNAKQAILAFSGDVYRGLDAGTLTEDQLKLAQKRVRILSGLYGVLKPLDLIRPYRLEMGTPLKYYRKKDLYAFWEGIITKKIYEALNESGNSVLVNLASMEYFKSIDIKRIKADVVTPEFKDMKNGKNKTYIYPLVYSSELPANDDEYADETPAKYREE